MKAGCGKQKALHQKRKTNDQERGSSERCSLHFVSGLFLIVKIQELKFHRLHSCPSKRGDFRNYPANHQEPITNLIFPLCPVHLLCNVRVGRVLTTSLRWFSHTLLTQSFRQILSLPCFLHIPLLLSKIISETIDDIVVRGKDTTDAYGYLPCFDGLDCRVSD